MRERRGTRGGREEEDGFILLEDGGSTCSWGKDVMGGGWLSIGDTAWRDRGSLPCPLR